MFPHLAPGDRGDNLVRAEARVDHVSRPATLRQGADQAQSAKAELLREDGLGHPIKPSRCG